MTEAYHDRPKSEPQPTPLLTQHPGEAPSASGGSVPLANVIGDLLDALDDEQRTADLAFAMQLRRAGAPYYGWQDVSLRELVLEALGVGR